MVSNGAMLSGMGWTAIRFVAVTALGFALNLAAQAFGLNQQQAQLAFWVSVAIFVAWALAELLWRLRGLIPARRMPITAAAQFMYNRASPELRKMARVVARASGDGHALTDYFADALGILAGSGHIMVFGKREPGLVFEQIPAEYFEDMVEIKGNNVGSLFGHGRVDWYELHVSKRDALKGLKLYEIDEQRLRLNKEVRGRKA